MDFISPIPETLADNYRKWRSSSFTERSGEFARLASEGQSPRAMVISCCDSRVQIEHILGAEPGEMFIHRNIASLVHPFSPDGDTNGTSAALEFGVTALNVSHLIIVGHSQCGGVKGCAAICDGKAPELERSLVGQWIGVLKPKFELVRDESEDEKLRKLEHHAVRMSLENLMTFPFVRDRVEDGRLALHGLWADIGEGGLWALSPEQDAFHPL